jgi:branched-chain amino acid transport system substrate-binding protein
MMYQEGVRQLIIVYRQDTYGSGLANATAARFTALGGTVVDKIPYDTATTDFSTVLSTMQSDWSKGVSAAGGNASKVAIQAVSFEELGTMLLQAKSSFPSLLNTTQPWYGTDGEADDAVLTNSTYASIMNQIRLPSTLYIQTNTTRTNTICVTELAQTHSTCDAYSLGSYDDVWLLALSVLHCGTYSGACISKVLPEIANESVGVTGPLALQSNHDRIPVAYNVWTVVGTGSTANWIIAGTWTIANDTVAWTSEPKH